jgi:hypothetical protein
MRSKFSCDCRKALLAALILSATVAGLAQSTNHAQDYPSHLPYAFSNFVWWSDDELRTQLKRRIAGLGDEIAPDSDKLGKIRDTLKEMLRERGIQADVLSEEPSTFALTAERAPGAPPTAIVFSILSPPILIDKVVINQAPESLADLLRGRLQSREGHEYSSRQDWLPRSDVGEVLESHGYLEAHVDIAHDAPRTEGNRYLVNLLISLKPGPQYHLSSIAADGGPSSTGEGLVTIFCSKARRRCRPESIRDVTCTTTLIV